MGTAYLRVNEKWVSELKIPNTVKSIKNFAFERCSLTSVFIPENVASIGQEEFSGRLTLKSIVISNGVKEIKFAITPSHLFLFQRVLRLLAKEHFKYIMKQHILL